LNAICERMNALTDDMEPLADEILDAEVATLAGLRAKVLAAIYRAMPALADQEHGMLCEFGDVDQRALLVAAAAVVGLSPLVDDIETSAS
jgi:phosphoserine phosphatase